LGEGGSISGKEFMAAIVVGDDLSARLHIVTDRLNPATLRLVKVRRSDQSTTDNFGAAAIAGRRWAK
jgi:hypothetical protein